MTIQKYHIVIVDKSTGEIYLDIISKSIDLHSSVPFNGYVERYLNILRLHPSACLSIEPERQDYIEASLFV